MKKLFFASSLLMVALNLNAQDTQPQENQTNFNEVKLNGLYLVIGAFDVAYERTINEESAFGVDLFLPFDNDIDINYYVSPYYRFYFGKKYAAGFFVEGFGMLNSIDYERFNSSLSSFEDENVTDFALGIGLGGKWITKSGFIGELNLGIGRNLFENVVILR